MPFISDFSGEYVGTRATEDMEPMFSLNMMKGRSRWLHQVRIRRGNKLYFPSQVEPDEPEPLNISVEGARGPRGPKGDTGVCGCIGN